MATVSQGIKQPSSPGVPYVKRRVLPRMPPPSSSLIITNIHNQPNITNPNPPKRPFTFHLCFPIYIPLFPSFFLYTLYAYIQGWGKSRLGPPIPSNSHTADFANLGTWDVYRVLHGTAVAPRGPTNTLGLAFRVFPLRGSLSSRVQSGACG